MTVHSFKKNIAAPILSVEKKQMIKTIGTILLHLEEMASGHELTAGVAGIRYAQTMLTKELNGYAHSHSLSASAKHSFEMLQEDLAFMKAVASPNNIVQLRS
jgi:hypothetical protein